MSVGAPKPKRDRRYGSADADRRGLEAQNGLLIGPFDQPAAWPARRPVSRPSFSNLKARRDAAFPSAPAIAVAKVLTALVGQEKVILDRDRGTELIDAQTEAAGVIGNSE